MKEIDLEWLCQRSIPVVHLKLDGYMDSEALKDINAQIMCIPTVSLFVSVGNPKITLVATAA